MNPYLRIIRLHQPTGIALLLLPCWWGIALASAGFPSLWLMGLFAVGAVVMRGAGCIINDIWDRDFDKQVARTRTRPLASGELSIKQAAIFLMGLLFIALLIALALPRIDFYLACFSLLLVVAYPAMKRFTWWPQAFLGLTFNWGVLMGYGAVSGSLSWSALWLYVAGFFWTLAYDTIYAHQDASDDVKAGVKSTALKLASNTKPALVLFYTLMFLCIALSAILQSLSPLFYPILFGIWFSSLQIVKNVRLDDPADCMKHFKFNAFTGVLVLLAIIFAY